MPRAQMALVGVAFLALALAAGWAASATSYVDCDSSRASCEGARAVDALRASLPAARDASVVAALVACGIALMGYPPRALWPVAGMLAGGVVAYALAEFARRFAGSAPGATPDALLSGLADPLALLAALLVLGALVLAFVLQARAPPAAAPPRS